MKRRISHQSTPGNPGGRPDPLERKDAVAGVFFFAHSEIRWRLTQMRLRFCPSRETVVTLEILMRALLSSLLISTTGLALVPSPADTPIRGFSPQSARAEQELETRFKTLPDPAHMREAMRRLSARPHHVGSPYDRDNA